jgi:lysozyme family protein
MPTYGSTWPTYAKQWDGMTLKPSQLAEINATAKRLVAAKARYQAVEAKTGVPWYWIAATHEREASQSWSKSLAQGDPWNRVSTHVPRGRGPFPSWEAAAIDALQLDGVSRVKDWRLEKLLYYWELYNGWGYHNKGLPSPYVWGATSVQRPGKYVSDGVWSSTAVDKQLGTAAMLKAMMALDPSIKPIREGSGTPDVTPVPPVVRLTGHRWVQDTLNKVLVPSPGLDVDGDYGPATVAAIKRFQAAHGLVVDGLVGDKTTDALDAELTKKPAVATATATATAVPPMKSWWRRMLGM